MRNILSTVVTMVILLITLPAFAAHPLATDDAGTNGTLKFQVETSAELLHNH